MTHELSRIDGLGDKQVVLMGGSDWKLELIGLVEVVKDVSDLPDGTTVLKTSYGNLVRRIKLLSPLFDELIHSDHPLGFNDSDHPLGFNDSDHPLGFNDSDHPLDHPLVISSFHSLRLSLEKSLSFLRSLNQSSQLFQAMDRDQFAFKFHQITHQIQSALSLIPYHQLHLSQDVLEQIQLVHSHFTRATHQMDDIRDIQMEMDLAIAINEKEPHPDVLQRLSQKLQLRTMDDLVKESIAFNQMVISNEDSFHKMISLLRKLKDCLLSTTDSSQTLFKHRSPVIPDDFRCPVSLELMKDPVIVSTGQTYERSCIQKWLDAGHKTCPKTQQTLLHTSLTPNYVLKSLISLWCESNGVELPPKQATGCKNTNTGNIVMSDCDRAAIDSLLNKLANGDPDAQRAAAGELRLLAKRNADNRVCIAEEGAIPVLVELLSSPDSRTQEHAVTALLNLSINEANKGTIVHSGAIPGIVEVLKNGSMEARENAAATLFSLSVGEENKVTIGAAGAIPALVDLLVQGTPRGKKDAATAIFNLSINQGNKVRAVRAGIVSPLMSLLKDIGGGMVDEALAILAILASHHEGKLAIGLAEPIPVLMEVIRTGSPRNGENAAAVVWSLVCSGDVNHLKVAREFNGEEVMKELSENGTDRAKRKAVSILELL